MASNERTQESPSGPILVPSFDELMWPAIRALKEMGGSGTNEELLAKVIQLEGLPPEVQAFPHNESERQTKRLQSCLGEDIPEKSWRG
jgi:hypothetical protein